MKETLVIDPKGLNYCGVVSRMKCDNVCLAPNFGKRPLGSEILASLRDSLLPRLMRGEVRVK
jgi:hypothetical protein